MKNLNKVLVSIGLVSSVLFSGCSDYVEISEINKKMYSNYKVVEHNDYLFVSNNNIKYECNDNNKKMILNNETSYCYDYSFDKKNIIVINVLDYGTVVSRSKIDENNIDNGYKYDIKDCEIVN